MINNKLIGQKIKDLRKKNNLSQQELADKLNVSFQAISNWERGTTQIDINNLLELSKEFKVSVDFLLADDNNCKPFYLGIDGGGTKTEFVIFDENGIVKDRLLTSSSNPNDIGIDSCVSLIRDNINKCLCIYPNIKYVFGGISGILTGDNLIILSNAINKSFPSLNIKFDSDIVNLFYLKDKIDACLIIGTGSVLFIKEKDKMIQFGGLGYLLDDYGSGYDIGKAAIKIFLNDMQNNENTSFITNLMMKDGFNYKNLLSNVYAKGKTYIASFAHYVFDAYKNEDKNAIEIIQEQANYLNNLIQRSMKTYKFNHEILLSGGIANHYKEILVPLLKAKDNNFDYITSTMPPVFGACKMALQLSNMKSDNFENNFKFSYDKLLNK